ncbi:glucosaminidase domain-containing protein, partial [Weissella diestrammenae]
MKSKHNISPLKYLLILFLLPVILGLFKPTVQADTISNFKNWVAPGVRSSATRYNTWGSVMMAQAALESGWGQSALSTQANNFFGIKGTYNGQYVTMRTAEYDANGNIYYVNAQFRKYPSPEQSMDDNGSLIRNGLSWNHAYYSQSWKENAKTYQDAARALVGKYATDPNYGSKLIDLISQNGFDKLVDGNYITYARDVNYDAKIIDNNSGAGIDKNQPYLIPGSEHFGWVRDYKGQIIHIKRELTTSNTNVVWVEFSLDGQILYMQKDYAMQGMFVLETKPVNYTAHIDGINSGSGIDEFQ